jgi:hypothetical protein
MDNGTYRAEMYIGFKYFGYWTSVYTCPVYGDDVYYSEEMSEKAIKQYCEDKEEVRIRKLLAKNAKPKYYDCSDFGKGVLND